MGTTEIVDELKRLSRRINEQGKTIDLIMQDRNILEDILHRLGAVESALNMSRSTATENAKNAKEDISEIKDIVDAKVDEISQTIDGKTLIVKSPKESVLQKIINRVGGKTEGK